MKRSLVFFVLALFLMAGQLARAQSKQQIIDSLQQRIEELQHQVDTATFITGLEKLVNYLDWEFRETTDREAFYPRLNQSSKEAMPIPFLSG